MNPIFKAKHVSYSAALALTLAACGTHKSSSKPDDNGSATGGQVAAGGGGATTAPVTSLTADSVMKGFGLAGNALQSVGALSSNTPTALALTQKMTWTTYDDECDPEQSGWPKGFAQSGESGGTLDYNAAFVNCLMKEPDMTGETPMGALVQAAGMACAIGDQLVFDGLPHDITINFTADCFTQDYVDALTKAGAQTWTGKVIASTTDFVGNASGAWDGSVRLLADATINGQVQHADRIYLFKMDYPNQQYNILVTDGPETSGDVVGMPFTSGFIVGVDMKNGVLRYEGREQGLDSQGNPSGNRHIRTLAKGALDANGNFTSLTDSELIYSSLGFQTATDNGSVSIKTAKGNPTDGIYLNTFEEHGTDYGTAASFQNPLAACITSGASCTGNTGIQLTTDADYNFVLLPATAGKLEDWYDSASPLTFSEVKPVLVQ